MNIDRKNDWDSRGVHGPRRSHFASNDSNSSHHGLHDKGEIAPSPSLTQRKRHGNVNHTSLFVPERRYMIFLVLMSSSALIALITMPFWPGHGNRPANITPTTPQAPAIITSHSNINAEQAPLIPVSQENSPANVTATVQVVQATFISQINVNADQARLPPTSPPQPQKPSTSFSYMLESGWASTRRNPILKSKELWKTLAKYWDKRESFNKEADLSLLKIQNKSHNMIRGSTAGHKNNSMIIGSTVAGEKDNVHSFKSSDTHDGRTTFLFHEEARVIVDLFLKHLIVETHGRPGNGRPAQPAAPEEIISTMLPFELQLQESQRMLAMLRVIWDAHNDIQYKGMPSPKHCSTAAGRQLLLDLMEASKNLSESACHKPLSIYLNSSPHLEPKTSAFPLAVPSETSNASNISSSGRPPDMDSAKITNVTLAPPPVPKPRPPVKVPYVLLRRLTLALLHVLYEEPHFGMGQGVHARCRLAVQEVSGSIVQAFASAMNCSRPSRLAMELLHISKSGGTSMCQLAKDSGFLNPTEDIDGNCLLPFFYDEPKWSRLEAGLDAKKLWPAADCPAWVMSPDLSCDIRAVEVHRRGVNYYSNEGHLHEGTSMEGSAHACPQFETVIVLRHPVDRTRSHITEIDRVYNRFARGRSEYKRPRDLENWTHWAPAAINNYVTRSLLGRHFMHCKDFGALGEKELLAAAVALSSLDHILVLEEGDLNDVAMRAGMGWIAGLASKRWRWSTIQDLQHDLGFPPGTMNKIQDWNLLDILLYVWGNALLRLDVSFHAATAALAHRVVSEPCPLGQRGTATSGSGAASTLAPLDTSTSIVPVVKDMDEALKVAGLVKLSTPGMVQMSRGKLPFSIPGVRVIYRTGYINMDNKRKSESGMAYSMEHVLFGLVNTSLRSLFSNASLHSECPQRIFVSRRAAVDSNFTLQHGALLYQLPLYAHIPLPDLPLITLPPKRRVARTHTSSAAPTVIMKREQHLSKSISTDENWVSCFETFTSFKPLLHVNHSYFPRLRYPMITVFILTEYRMSRD